MRKLHQIVFGLVCLGAFLSGLSGFGYGGPTRKKVLIFSSEDIHLPGMLITEEAIRSTLNIDSSHPVTFYSEAQDNARIPNESYEKEYVDFLRQKYAGHNLDIIFVRSPPGIRFLLKHEAELFTGVPKIFITNDRRELAGLNLGDNFTGVFGNMGFAPTLDLILAQRPATKRLAVITGSSVQDEAYLEQVRRDFAAYGSKIEITYLSAMTMPDLQRQTSMLQPDSVCLFISYGRDPAGNGYSLPEAISLVTPTASVPIYALADSAIGSGAVGGEMLSFQLMGERAGQMGLRILSGQKPTEISPQIVDSVPIFDWRQLRRWEIDENVLPQGSIVRFREPSAWELYRWWIVGFAAFSVFQTSLIGWLLVLRARRREAVMQSLKFAALAEAEHQRLDAVVSNVPGVVWESRLEPGNDTRTTRFVSEYAEKMLGYPLEEWTSTPGFLQTIVLEEDREMVARRMQDIFDSSREGIVQFRWKAKDGSVFWAEAHLVAICDENDNPVGLRGVTMDVTESKRAEESLAESEERYRNVVETQTELICRYLPDTTLTFVNDAYCRYFDKSREELIGTRFVDLIPPHDREAALSQISSLIESEESITYEHEVVLPDGTRGWQQWTDRSVATLNGDTQELQGIGRDITAMRLAEEALRVSENRFRIMADSAPVLIWMCGPDKRCTYVNQGWLNFTGRSIDRELGSGWMEGIHRDDVDQTGEIFDSAFDRQEPFRLEYRLRRADGEFRWLYDSGSPRFSSEGEFLGFIGSCVDITDRKLAEAAAARSHEEVVRLQKQLQEENIYLKEVIQLDRNFDEIIGHSDALNYILFKIEQVAPTDATVLITGETGTGKELVARAIHNISSRSSRPLVTVNCASLSATLIESELFGHERGAFTGAAARKIGRFELADGATLFLDEVGELPLELQPKLLRVIQEGEFERLGSSKTIKTDVRIIAATNRDLEAEVKNGRFRADLLFRLNVVPISVPPLRDRRDDIPELIEHFTSRFAKKLGKNIKSISPATTRRLCEHSWPGNIRELANVIERSVINTRTENLHVADYFEPQVPGHGAEVVGTLEEIERKHITQTLELTKWKIEGPNGAARILGLNPSTLRHRLSKLGIIIDKTQRNNSVDQ